MIEEEMPSGYISDPEVLFLFAMFNDDGKTA
jgi:hypothetical protein